VLLGGCSAFAARVAPGRGGAPVAAAGTLDGMGWLLGHWRGTGEGEEFHEQYQAQDDSTFRVVYFTDCTRTAARPDSGTLEQRAGRLYHTRGRARWLVTERSSTSLVFHPVEGAAHRFRWILETPAWRTAVVTRLDGRGREVTQTYSLRRLDHQHDWLGNTPPLAPCVAPPAAADTARP
jgi:hypothetical protein